ncbi:MAG: cache domain-containing protein [Chloroflexota bacterium]
MLRVRRRSGLRRKIILWSFVPTTLILLAVALVTFFAYQQVTEDLVIGRNRELTRLSAGQVAATLTDYTDTLTTLGRMPGIYRGLPALQRSSLVAAKDRLVVFDGGVVVLDDHGRVSAAEPDREDIIGQDWSDRTYYRQVMRSLRPAFSDVVTDGPAGSPVVVVAVPITGEQGEFVGTLAGMFRVGTNSVSSFYGAILKLRIDGTGGTYVVDGRGKVLYHTDPALIGSDASGQAVAQEALLGKVGELRFNNAQGRSIVASYAPVPGTSWGLVVQERWEMLTSSGQGYKEFLLLLLVLGVLVPAFVVGFGVKRITQPIEGLIAVSQEVAGGKFGRSVSVNTDDELEDLAEQFNLMSAQLQASYANLEQRVADRTRDLATLNAISATVSRSLDIDEILHDALIKTIEITIMDAGAAFRLDEDGRSLALVAHHGLSEEAVRCMARLPIGAGAAKQAASEGGPVAMRISDFADVDLRELLEREGMKLAVGVPLLARGRMLGTFSLTTQTPRPLTDEELSLLAGIGHQIGVALENAELYKQAGQSAAAAERSRLARELHDAVTQTLFSASLIAEVLPRLWDRKPEEGRRRLDELRQLTRGALAEMRTLLLELRPSALLEAALGDLLRHLADAMIGRARIPVSLTVEGQRALPPDVQVALYRIAQEALNNIAKHAEASTVSIALAFMDDRVELSVSDDGRGFDPRLVPPDHLGLGIMRERAEAITATLRVASQPGSGTTVTVVWRDGSTSLDMVATEPSVVADS